MNYFFTFKLKSIYFLINLCNMQKLNSVFKYRGRVFDGVIPFEVPSAKNRCKNLNQTSWLVPNKCLLVCKLVCGSTSKGRGEYWDVNLVLKETISYGIRCVFACAKKYCGRRTLLCRKQHLNLLLANPVRKFFLWTAPEYQ